ncbi:hypothetical protein ACYEXS_35440, partial [Paenibacillus sp. MAH-36]
YMFFKKKLCPGCGAKMKKKIKDHSLGDKSFVDQGVDGKTLYTHTERIVRSYAYHCDVCNIEYPIQQLASKSTTRITQ